jgi:hypothetical protein
MIAQDRHTKSHLARCEIRQSIVREDEGDVCLGLRIAFVHSSGVFEIDSPYRDFLCPVGHLQLKNAVRLRITHVNVCIRTGCHDYFFNL